MLKRPFHKNLPSSTSLTLLAAVDRQDVAAGVRRVLRHQLALGVDHELDQFVVAGQVLPLLLLQGRVQGVRHQHAQVDGVRDGAVLSRLAPYSIQNPCRLVTISFH